MYRTRFAFSFETKMKVLRHVLWLHEALQYRSFPLENEEKSTFSLEEYFAYNLFFEKDRRLGFSPLKSASKTTSSNVCHTAGVTGRCNDGRYHMD